MKKKSLYQKMLLVLFIITALSSSAQKQFTHTATKANNYCNANCTLLDIPDLNNNPAAIIFATPLLENGLNLNPHPIGIYYFKSKWSIFNLDQRPISEGAKFNVEYVAKPDSTHFQYLITKENLQKDGSAVIDHLPINNPNTQLRFIPCWAPEFHIATVNRDEVSLQFNKETSKWYISNINKKPLFERVGYNIIASERSSSSYSAVQINELNVVPISNLSTQPCKCPTSLPPNGMASGDLSGNYPGPTVQKLLGRALSNTSPNIGQVLKWDGAFWQPANDNTSTGGAINTELWKNNGSNISNGNSGNVGIGTTNPNSPLGFPPVIGKKITLYPGTSGDIGFGVAGNRLQIYADNPNADVAIGYDAAGIFNERFAVKANGSLAVNGNTGNAGQVLASNGNSSAYWRQLPYAYGFEVTGPTYITNPATILNVPGLSNAGFEIKSQSTVIFTVSLGLHHSSNSIFITGTDVSVFLKIFNAGNNLIRTIEGRTRVFGGNSNFDEDYHFSNSFPLNLAAGTYRAEVTVERRGGQTLSLCFNCSSKGSLIINIFPQ